MAGASIETTLELWASSLRDVKQRMRPLFSQDRVAASAGQFLDGLLVLLRHNLSTPICCSTGSAARASRQIADERVG